MGLLLVEAGLVVAFFKDPLALHAASTEDTVVGEAAAGDEEKKEGGESEST